MNRNQLKQLWFSLPHEEKKEDVKVILVDTKTGIVKIIEDTKNAYHSFSTHQGKNALQYALDRQKENNGLTDFTKFNLIVK
tara:strand:+ start:156 stop:398 length:243 start_codon:yes stop_codon:yes gene_type:complete